MLRQQSCRQLVANDRSRWRLIGSQTGIGNVPRLQEGVERKCKQAKDDQIRRDGDTDRRTLYVYAITGHRDARSTCPPGLRSVRRSTAGNLHQSGITLNTAAQSTEARSTSWRSRRGAENAQPVGRCVQLANATSSSQITSIRNLMQRTGPRAHPPGDAVARINQHTPTKTIRGVDQNQCNRAHHMVVCHQQRRRS
jgi:hypothetical protein